MTWRFQQSQFPFQGRAHSTWTVDHVVDLLMGCRPGRLTFTAFHYPVAAHRVAFRCTLIVLHCMSDHKEGLEKRRITSLVHEVVVETNLQQPQALILWNIRCRMHTNPKRKRKKKKKKEKRKTKRKTKKKCHIQLMLYMGVRSRIWM